MSYVRLFAENIPLNALPWQAMQMFIYIHKTEWQVEAHPMPPVCCSTSNRPRATGKILLTTCKAWPGSDRKGNQQRAKVTNTVAATLTNRKSLGEEGRTVKQTHGKSGPGGVATTRRVTTVDKMGPVFDHPSKPTSDYSREFGFADLIGRKKVHGQTSITYKFHIYLSVNISKCSNKSNMQCFKYFECQTSLFL